MSFSGIGLQQLALGVSSIFHVKHSGTVWRSTGNKVKTPHHSHFTLRSHDLIQADSKLHIKRFEIEKDEFQNKNLEITRKNKDKIKKGVESIKKMLESIEDGEITISAYDTAWVAMVKDVDGSESPQFPSSLEWIANNQFSDGSWGLDNFFSAYDRLLSTIACVVALKSWNVHPQKCEKGINFFLRNLNELENERNQHMLCGFEIVFPSLLERAQDLGMQIPTDSPVFQKLYARREEKLRRIPKDILHKVPTTLLFSLEGMEDLKLNWEQLLQLKCKDGSFLTSPSSTACALMHAKDETCLQYLTNIVHKFNGGVPNIYPLGTYERIWVVDRLRRLGICRYFQPQISDVCMRYIERSWQDKGIGTTTNSNVPDIDDTCMAFRLLRLYGHHVSADVFRNFKKDDEFFCFGGQSDEGVTVIYNLYRASQVLFPGETILEDARQFAYKFLKEKKDENELFDKWIISKDLPGEIEYGLDVPWYASLPRIETRYYLDHYGGADDVWIAKVLYRLPYVNNNTYLEVAKQDYNNCQALHRCEWEAFQKWYKEFELGDFGVNKEALLQAYFVATSNIYEPERSKERLAWAKTSVLVEIITTYAYQEDGSSDAFVHEFLNKYENYSHINERTWDTEAVENGIVRILLTTLINLSHDSNGKAIGQELLYVWKDWIRKWQEEGEKHVGEAELLARTILLTSGHSSLLHEIFSHPHYHSLVALTNSVCYQLRLYQKRKVHDSTENHNVNFESCMTTPQIETEMQQLVELVLDNSMNHIDPQIKHIFLAVAKSFYYTAFFPTSIINLHSAKVLFHKVD